MGRLDEINIRILDRLEPGWRESATELRWRRKYRELDEFVSLNNRFPSQYSADVSEKSISVWCRNQKTYFRAGTLASGRSDQLERIQGWNWGSSITASPEDAWNSNFENLITFLKVNNKFPSKRSADVSEKSLAEWCKRQKRRFGAGKLPHERVQELQQINLLPT